MHVINLAGASTVKNPRTDQVHEAGPDGVFADIPLDFAHELVTKHASQWREASAHEAAVHQAKVEELRNPHVLPAVLAEVREQGADHAARLDALEARFEALSAQVNRTAETGSADDDAYEFDGLPESAAEPQDAKPARSQRARKTAAAKPKAARAGGDGSDAPTE